MLAANPQGEIRCGESAALAFGPDGKSYQALPGGGLKVSGRNSILADSLDIHNLTVRNNGDIYAVTGSELWLLRATGEKVKLDQGLKAASGVAFTPDGLWLFVAQRLSRNGLSYRVRSDGTLDAKEPFYDFDVPAWADDSGAAGIGMDRDGRAYVATRIGVQVFDRNGRVAAILPLPGNAAPTNLCFGGKDFDTLFVAGGGKLYRRKLGVQGAPPWAAPGKLPSWGAG
jgi:gluconolactonase